MQPETAEYRQYVVTLARLIETIQTSQDPNAYREAMIAIGKMREHVVSRYGPLLWEACEDDANQTLQAQHQGLIL